AALGVAVLVPALLPGLDARLLDGGNGEGGGGAGGSRSVTTYNPITRLRGELSLPEPIDVLRYSTDDPQPDYLRMTTLGLYDGGGWRQEVLRGNLRDDGVDDPIPVPVGRSSTARSRTVSAQLSILSLDAFWLPLPATPSTVQVDGPWMWDAGSESVFATRSNTSRVTSYTVRSSRALPDPALLGDGEAAVPPEIEPYATPVEATERVRVQTARIIRNQTTDYGKALAIQSYFRNPANGFTYSDETESGGSPDALEDFLSEKTGFCEQYASAMGAMLRLAGVPSRVAVGFTPGIRQADGQYLVTTDQAHAWPEAWFEGAGWVRFEPTPSRGGITPPSYTPAAPVDTAGPAAAPSQAPLPADPSIDGVETPAERAERMAAERDAQGVAVAASESGSGGPPVRELALGASGLLLLVSPALLHLLRRRRRWRSPNPHVAWEQLRDDAGDSGHDWRPAESPRAAGARLVAQSGLTGEPAAAAGRLTAAVERARYALPGPVDRDAERQLSDDSATVRRALRSGAPLGRRLRCVLLPPSTLRWASAQAGSRTADVLDALDRTVSAVGARLRRRSA
ncbi:MAG TPA: DUF3488 and transglutaminase-like domain-containing protein, partial [Mycobacteriales bacterium]|nr:DUF3488 and transglutaminase-like domain-containing protein [Mycobacteriales bacterium]